MLESEFQNKVIKFLKTLDNVWIVKVWGGGFQRAGIPDILACVNGRFVAIELKKEGGRASALQVRNLNQIEKCGGISILLYPNDFVNFKDEINRILKQ